MVSGKLTGICGGDCILLEASESLYQIPSWSMPACWKRSLSNLEGIKIMKDYEVTDLFEAGNAGETIESKQCACVDEISGMLGPEGFEER